VVTLRTKRFNDRNFMFVWPRITRKTTLATNKMQQRFGLLIFLIQPYTFRATNSPLLRSTFWLYIQLLVQWTDTAADRCHGWDGTDVEFKRLMNEKFVAYCWLLTSLILENYMFHLPSVLVCSVRFSEKGAVPFFTAITAWVWIGVNA